MSRGVAPLEQGRLSPLFRTRRRDISRSGVLERVLVRGLELGASAGRAVLGEGARRSALLELGNCIVSFKHFRRATAILRLDPEAAVPLARQVEASERLGKYRSLWSLEGLGFARAERAQRRGEPRGLLAAETTGGLSAGCLVPLHAGMGLSFANLLLCRGVPDGRSETAELIARFRRLCERNATPGCAGVAIEMLGFLLRTHYPQLLAELDRALRDTDPELLGFLWHGAGRALYFCFPRVLHSPGCGWWSVGLTRSEPPHEIGRSNALSGFALALLLVNVRQPEIVERFVRHHGAELGAETGCAAGICSACVIWHAWAGRDRHLERLLAHRPDPADEGLARCWDRMVSRPCRQALAGRGAEIRRRRRFGDLFDVHRLAPHPGDPP